MSRQTAADTTEPCPIKRKRIVAWSRQGCLACKARRVKCSEEKPSCKKCLRRGNVCEYPELKIRQHSIGKESVSLPSPSPSPPGDKDAAVILAIQPSFSSAEQKTELKLLHHFRNFARPSMPPVSANTWLQDVPQRAQSTPVLMHAILSLSATHLASRDKSITLPFILDHRQKAFRGMNDILRRAPDQIPLADLDTVLASSYALARQSCFLPDGLSEAMTLYRICEAINEKAVLKDSASARRLFRGPSLVSHEMKDMIALLDIPPVDPRLLQAGEQSLLAFRHLCSENSTWAYFHQSMVDEVRGYAESEAKGWDISAEQWKWLMQLPHRDLNRIVKSKHPAALCLCSHWFSLGMFQDRQECTDTMDEYLPALVKVDMIERFCKPLQANPEYKHLVRWPLQLASVLRQEHNRRGWMSVSDAIEFIYQHPDLFI